MRTKLTISRKPAVRVSMTEEPRSRTDIWVKGGAVVLAGAAVVFPWYVFFNQDKFGVSVAGWEQLRDVHSFRQRDVVEVPPMSIARKPMQDDPTDTLTTATVPKSGTGDDKSDDAGTAQPLPGRSSFRLVHVSNGRALIEDASGMYLVQVGSVLPDNTRLASLSQKNGKWVILTSSGESYEDQQ